MRAHEPPPRLSDRGPRVCAASGRAPPLRLSASLGGASSTPRPAPSARFVARSSVPPWRASDSASTTPTAAPALPRPSAAPSTGRRIGEAPASRAAARRRATLGALATAASARSRSARGSGEGPRPQPRGRAYADPVLARSDLEREGAALAVEPFAPDPHADAYTLRTLLSDPTAEGVVFFLEGSAHFWRVAKALGWTPPRLWRAIMAAGPLVPAPHPCRGASRP